mmetsp:Transcript_2307/g.4973  ORF Transcript_2307/g.4973 Transcript_2307/m.4973 type:complete len:574 (+) Transcript_2307:139-1860(+)
MKWKWIRRGQGGGRRTVLVAGSLLAVFFQVLAVAEAQNVTSTATQSPFLDLDEGILEISPPSSTPLDASMPEVLVSSPTPGSVSHNSTQMTPLNPQAPPPAPATTTTLATVPTPMTTATTSASGNSAVTTPSTSTQTPPIATGSVADPPAPSPLPECGGLVCQNDSACRDGNRTYNIDTDVGFHTVTNQNGYHCDCPKGFSGLDCSRPFEDCNTGVNVKCFHGGTCLPESMVEDTEYASYCECSDAFFEGQRYAGKYCEVAVEETEYCPEQQGLFCLNGGSCPSGGPRAPHICQCRDGYTGEHCEFIAPEGPDCTLECFNEGVCKVGRVNAPWGNIDDFYCDCPTGFGGIRCEHLSETCDDGNTVCLHGAMCESLVKPGGTTEFSCACSTPYLGGSGCEEKRRMELCMPTLGPEYSLGMAVPAFCLNGGKCRDVMNGNVVDFSCDCPPLFEGPHCEFLKTADSIGDIDDLLNPPGSDRSAGAVAGSVALATLAMVAGFFVIRQVRRIRQSRKRERDVILNLQEFRDENFGAISANGSMLFPGVSPPPSTIPISEKSGSSNFAQGELLHEVDIT